MQEIVEKYRNDKDNYAEEIKKIFLKYIRNSIFKRDGKCNKDLENEIMCELLTDWINKNPRINWTNYIHNNINHYISNFFYNKSSMQGLSFRENVEWKNMLKDMDNNIVIDSVRYEELRHKVEIGKIYEIDAESEDQHSITDTYNFAEEQPMPIIDNCLSDIIKELLSKRDFEIFMMKSVYNYTFEEIGVKQGFSKQRASKIYDKIVNRLSKNSKIIDYKNKTPM